LEVALVAEIKESVADLETAEKELRKYMVSRQCPVGMIVTPEHTWVYHDTFADTPGESIARVGEFITSELLRVRSAPRDERALQRAVQAWLEQVASGWLHALPASLEMREPLLAHLVPAVIDGRVTTGVVVQ
jgi:hypothetical protein